MNSNLEMGVGCSVTMVMPAVERQDILALELQVPLTLHQCRQGRHVIDQRSSSCKSKSRFGQKGAFGAGTFITHWESAVLLHLCIPAAACRRMELPLDHVQGYPRQVTRDSWFGRRVHW